MSLKPREASTTDRFPLRRLVRAAWLSLVLLSFAAPVRGRTITVATGGAFASIQRAVASAQPGDMIEVRSGTYAGNLVLDKPVNLIGIDRPIIRGDGRGSVVTITGGHCTLRGLIIERSGDMLVDEDSGILLKSSYNQIEQNELRDVLFGIYLYGSEHNQIVSNIIRGRALPDLGERGSGIHIWNAGDNTIVNNSITDARDGMYLQNAHNSTIRGNRVFNLRYGLHYMYSDDNVFEDNIFDHNVAGAAIMYSRNIQFRRNAFVHNRGFSSFGILFQGTDECLAEDNIIADNVVGLFLEAHNHSVFRRNLIAANDVALQVFSSAADNTFELNNFVDNLSPLQIVGKSTTTQWNGAQSGNYWSDYDGYDLDGDGIGDIPFKIQNVFEHLEGNYPRLRIYLLSPGSQALALAEKGFPVIEGAKEFDQRPLMRPAALSFTLADVSSKPSLHLSSFALPGLILLVSLVVFRQGRKR
jgi:nitrous oxidase accessory protein